MDGAYAISCYLFITVHTFLKTVDFKIVIRDGRANTILTEATGFDAQLAQYGKDGGVDAPVALEFDDDQVVDRSRLSRFVIQEADAEIDGQALRFGIINQGDAVKSILYGGNNVVEGVPRALREEVLAIMVVDDRFNGGNLNALLAGFAVVVLLLHL